MCTQRFCACGMPKMQKFMNEDAVRVCSCVDWTARKESRRRMNARVVNSTIALTSPSMSNPKSLYVTHTYNRGRDVLFLTYARTYRTNTARIYRAL